jgi:hypothetical protein
VQPPSVEGPTTGRHRTVHASATAPAAARPSRLVRTRDALAAFSAHPPQALRWALLGAALVILIAVPLMNTSHSQPDTTAETATTDAPGADPTARVPSPVPAVQQVGATWDGVPGPSQ